MSENTIGFIIMAVATTFLICLFLFERKDESKSEVGRYTWGRNGISVLDSTDGTVYYMEGFGGDEVSIVEVDLPSGIVWRKKGVVKEFGE